jgi:hypothetical protein
MPLATYEAATLFSRSRSQFIAIRRLLEDGLQEEAFTLSRGLFTDSLRLEYLAAASTETREAIFLHRQREAYTAFRAKFGARRRKLDLEGLSDEELVRVHQELRKIKARARRLGVDIGTGYPSDESLASQFGREEDFWVHLISHDAVHGSQLMLRRRTSSRGDFVAIATRDFDPEWMCGIGIHSMKAALRSHIYASALLGWDGGPANTLLEAVSAWEAELDARRTESTT